MNLQKTSSMGDEYNAQCPATCHMEQNPERQESLAKSHAANEKLQLKNTLLMRPSYTIGNQNRTTIQTNTMIATNTAIAMMCPRWSRDRVI
mmetsp:Transcript_3331/g.11165  ORF Transcript_3331/g.11165 Transcript_3331/m.11165 type:complete len:91 (-) Transcript_3331:2142-2414(-)